MGVGVASLPSIYLVPEWDDREQKNLVGLLFIVK